VRSGANAKSVGSGGASGAGDARNMISARVDLEDDRW